MKAFQTRDRIHERFSNEGSDFLTYHGLVSSIMTYKCRGAG